MRKKMNDLQYIYRGILRYLFLFLFFITILFTAGCEHKIELERCLTSDSGWWSYSCEKEKGTIEFCKNGVLVFSNNLNSKGGTYKINKSETELELILNGENTMLTISKITLENKRKLRGKFKIKGDMKTVPIILEKQQ
ncbi:MAG: hypothetical protein ACLRPU_00290 [Enterococcus hulanensis]